MYSLITGCFAQGRAEQVEQGFVAATGVDLKVVNAQNGSRPRLGSVRSGRERKIIGRRFIRVFEPGRTYEVVADAGEHGQSRVSHYGARCTPTSWNLAGKQVRQTSRATTTSVAFPTIFSSSLSNRYAAAVSKTRCSVILQLGLPPDVFRHPFPGPGLAIRIVGAIDQERLEILRDADAIAREELTNAGLDGAVPGSSAAADVRSVGVQGDGGRMDIRSSCGRCRVRMR